MPRVLTMRELRQGLSGVVDEVLAGEAVFAGSHRKPEVVLMSVRQYEQLTGAQQRVLDSAIEVGRELAAGRFDFAEYLRRVGG